MANHRENAAEIFETPWQSHVRRWKDCRACPLCEQRTNIVLARGQIPCDVLLVGEAPGASENLHGIPFVGPAGKLLNDILASVMVQLEPQTYRLAFTNLVACYPKEAKEAGTNEPAHKEILACAPRLTEMIKVAEPRLIVAVGSLADSYLGHSLLGMRAGGGVEGHATIQRWTSIVHPAFIKRLPMAQQGFAARKCVVTLIAAIEALV